MLPLQPEDACPLSSRTPQMRRRIPPLLPVPAVSRGCSPLSPVPLLSCTTPVCNRSISARFHGSAWPLSRLWGHAGSPCCWLAGQEPPALSAGCAGEVGGSLGPAAEQP